MPGICRTQMTKRCRGQSNRRLTANEKVEQMRRAISLLVVVINLVGCGGNSKPAATVAPEKKDAQAPVADTAPEQKAAVPDKPKQDPKIAAIKAKVSEYLAEARAGVKLLGLAPTLAKAREKSAQITELYIHLPELPPDLDPKGEIAERLKNINGNFALAAEYVKLQAEASGLGSQKLADDTAKGAASVQQSIRDFATEIETKLGLDK